MPATGVDGCRAGWVAAQRAAPLGAIQLRILASFAEVIAWAQGAVIGVDMPIGLPDAGPRRCDQEARQRLGRQRASSVFPAPIRAVLGLAMQPDAYAQANALQRRVDGRGLTRQCFNLLKKIREVDDALSVTPGAPERIFEVHPEVSFAVLAALPHGLPTGKKTAEGVRQRLQLLAPHFPNIGETLQRVKARGVAIDDLIDAVVVLWTAERIVASSAIAFPAGELLVDAKQFPMRITA